MKLVGVVLSNNSEEFVGDCLKSLLFCDQVVLIDSGITDRTLDIAREILGDRLVVFQRPSAEFFADPEGFASQRNFGLKKAHEVGGDGAVAVMLDTDERMVLPDGFDLRSHLAMFPLEKDRWAIQGRKDQYVYHKTKFFRLPVTHWYRGAVHEDHDDGYIEPQPSVPGHFWEYPKRRDPKIREEEFAELTARMGREPLEPRWPYFAAQTARLIGKNEEAIELYERAYNLNPPAEMAGMCMFWAAQTAASIKQLDRALDLVAKGLRRHIGVAELFWMGAMCEFELGHHEIALFWAHHAALAGSFKGVGKMVARSMEKVHKAQMSGPFDILRRCYGVLGMAEQFNQAHKEWLEAVDAEKQLASH